MDSPEPSYVSAAVVAMGTAVVVTTTVIAIIVVVSTTGTAAAATASALLVKYGLQPRALRETNILSPETSAERMTSEEVIRVKHAPDMNFMEAVRHFTFLLSKENLNFVNGQQCKDSETLHDAYSRYSKLKDEIVGFSEEIQEALKKYYPDHCEEQTHVVSSDLTLAPTATTHTANAATAMAQESKSLKEDSENSVYNVAPINKTARDLVIDKAIRSLAWAHDEERQQVPGASQITNDQVRRQQLR